VEVLEQKRTILARSLGFVRVWSGDTVAGRVDSVLGFGVPVLNVI